MRDVNIFLSGGMGNLSFEEQTKWRSNIKNEILFGLLAVKGLGESIVYKIIENRPYRSLEDFMDKVKCNKKYRV